MNDDQDTSAKAGAQLTPSQAVAALKRIGKHGEAAWQGWIGDIGPFVRERQALATKRAGATRGTTYAYHLEKAMGQFYEHYRKLSDNGTASHLMWCMENLAAITVWRDRLPEHERPSHPQRVRSAYEASLRSSILIEDMEDSEDFEDRDRPRRNFKNVRNTTNASKEELQVSVNKLVAALETAGVSGDPRDDVGAWWDRALQKWGNDRRAALAYAREYATALSELIATVEREWNAARPLDKDQN